MCDVTRDNSIVTAEGGEPCIGVEHIDHSSFQMITHPSEQRCRSKQEGEHWRARSIVVIYG